MFAKAGVHVLVHSFPLVQSCLHVNSFDSGCMLENEINWFTKWTSTSTLSARVYFCATLLPMQAVYYSRMLLTL